MIFRDTQEAIVDEDTWYVVQKIRETKHRPIAQGKANPLTGLMFCADCGAKMFNHRTKGYEKKIRMGIRLVNIPMHRIITPALPTARQRDILKTNAPSTT